MVAVAVNAFISDTSSTTKYLYGLFYKYFEICISIPNKVTIIMNSCSFANVKITIRKTIFYFTNASNKEISKYTKLHQNYLPLNRYEL